MRADQARTIPIDRYLETQGIKPDHVRLGGRELWYKSPIRQGDSTPSFKVDVGKNVWFDHGLGRGGNMLDLAVEFHKSSVSEALAHLERSRLYSPHRGSPQIRHTYTSKSDPAQPTLTATPKTASAAEKEKTALVLLSKKPLEHPALLQYLEKRCIDPMIAAEYISQIDFKAPQSASSYFALGYPAGEGFEARNALFKGFVGTGKDITLHEKPNAERLLIFEGFMDFLSYLTVKGIRTAPGTVLVLNSTSFKARALQHVNDRSYATIELYLDNDGAGDEVTKFFEESAERPEALQDMRAHYAGYDDLNAWIMDRSP